MVPPLNRSIGHTATKRNARHYRIRRQSLSILLIPKKGLPAALFSPEEGKGWSGKKIRMRVQNFRYLGGKEKSRPRRADGVFLIKERQGLFD